MSCLQCLADLQGRPGPLCASCAEDEIAARALAAASAARISQLKRANEEIARLKSALAEAESRERATTARLEQALAEIARLAGAAPATASAVQSSPIESSNGANAGGGYDAFVADTPAASRPTAAPLEPYSVFATSDVVAAPPTPPTAPHTVSSTSAAPSSLPYSTIDIPTRQIVSPYASLDLPIPAFPALSAPVTTMYDRVDSSMIIPSEPLPPVSGSGYSQYDAIDSSVSSLCTVHPALAAGHSRPSAVVDLTDITPPPSRGAGEIRSWNEEFQATFELPHSTPEAALSRAARMSRICADFTSAATALAQTIVKELGAAPETRTVPPVDVGGIAGGEKYIAGNMFFKFTRDWQGIYGGDQFAMKSASLEINNLTAYLEVNEPEIHVPLAVQIDYAGFRLIATSLLPIGSSTLIYGSSDQARTVRTDNPRLNTLMLRAASKLNIKPHVVGFGAELKMLASCADIEVHQGRDSRFYVVDTARVFPPEAPLATIPAFLLPTSGAVSLLDITRRSAGDEIQAMLGPYRVTSLPGASLFSPEAGGPLNGRASILAGKSIHGDAIVLSGERGQHLYFTLRKELVRKFPQPLSSDAFTQFGRHDADTHNAEVRDATNVLLQSVLPSLCAQLFGMDIMVAHPKQLESALHHVGINMRHIGIVRTLLTAGADTPNHALRVSEMLFTDMVTRVAKTIIRAEFRTRFGASTAAVGIPTVNTDDGMSDDLAKLVKLGFPRHVCEAALAANKGDINESIDWLLTFGSEYGVSPTATSSSHASDIRVTYGDSDLELVRWCMNTILGRGFTGERPGSGGKLTAFSLLFETAAYIHDTAAAEAFDHESFWGDLMRIYMQLKFGTQSPALSAEEMSPGFDLRSRVSLVGLAQSLCTQLGVKMTTRWITRMQRLLSANSGQVPPRLLRSSLTPEEEAAIVTALSDQPNISGGITRDRGQLTYCEVISLNRSLYSLRGCDFIASVPGELLSRLFGTNYSRTRWGSNLCGPTRFHSTESRSEHKSNLDVWSAFRKSGRPPVEADDIEELTVRSKAVQDDSVLLRQLRAAVMTPAAAALLSELEFVDNVPCFNSVTATPGVTFAANNTVVTLSDPLGRKYYSVPATPRFYRSDGTTTVEMHLIPGSDLNAVMVGFVRVPHKTPSTDYDIMNERNWWLYRPENGSWCNNGENHRAQDSLKATPTNEGMLFRLQLDTNRSEASLFVNGSRLDLMFTDLPSDQSPGIAAVRLVSVIGKFVVPSSSGFLKSAVSSLCDITACREHYRMTCDVFGPNSEAALDSGIALAEAAVRSGRADEAVGFIRTLFTQDAGGVSRVKFPVHSVARGYVVLGDACALSSRFAAAEAYFVLALKACDLVMVTGESQPFVMLVLDRLMGAVMAQGRPEHASSLIVAFERIWTRFPCPTGISVPYPLLLVFGRTVPNAFLLEKEQIPRGDGRLKCVQSPEFSNSSSKSGLSAWVKGVTDFTGSGIDVIAAVGLVDAAAEGMVPPTERVRSSLNRIRKEADEAAVMKRGSLYFWNGTQSETVLTGTGSSILSLSDDETVNDICASRMVVVAVSSKGRVFTFPSARDGPRVPSHELGHGDTLAAAVGTIQSPIRSLSGKVITQAACGVNFTLLLDAQGSVFSFGAGDHGQLGHGDLTNRDTPRVIQLLASQPIKLIAAGEHHSLCVAGNNDVFGWGKNTQGQLGLGHLRPTHHPEKLSQCSSAPIRHITAAGDGTVLLAHDGTALRTGKFTFFDRAFSTAGHPELVVPEVYIPEPPYEVAHSAVMLMSEPETSSNIAGDFSIRFVDAALFDSCCFFVTSDGDVYSHGRFDQGVTGHRRSSYVGSAERRINPRKLELPSDWIVFRVFGNGNLVYLSTNKGLAVIGEHSPIGLTLFALESRLDAVYASHGNRSSGNRATPALVPFFNGVPIRCVALSHYSSTQCYAVTGPAAVHDLDPRLFASYGDGSVPRPLLPPTAWMTVCSADGSPLEKCRPSATLSVSWSVPHVPFGDLLVLYDASCKHQTAFYQTDVPPLMASGTVLIPAPAASGNYTLSYVLMGKAESSYSRMIRWAGKLSRSFTVAPAPEDETRQVFAIRKIKSLDRQLPIRVTMAGLPLASNYYVGFGKLETHPLLFGATKCGKGSEDVDWKPHPPGTTPPPWESVFSVKHDVSLPKRSGVYPLSYCAVTIIGDAIHRDRRGGRNTIAVSYPVVMYRGSLGPKTRVHSCGDGKLAVVFSDAITPNDVIVLERVGSPVHRLSLADTSRVYQVSSGVDAPSLTPLLFNNEGWSADGNDTLPIISGEFQFPSPDVPGSYRLLLFTPIPRLGGPVIVTDVNARNVLGLSDGEIQLTPASSTVTTVDGYTLAAASTEFTYREAPSAGDSETTVLLREVMECYRRLFAKNGMPEGMIEDQLASIEPQFQAMPVVSLKSVIGSLKTQL